MTPTPILWTDNVVPLRRLVPLEPRACLEIEDDLPFEWQPYSGSERLRASDRAGCVSAVCVVVCASIVFWAAVYAAVASVWGML